MRKLAGSHHSLFSDFSTLYRTVYTSSLLADASTGWRQMKHSKTKHWSAVDKHGLKIQSPATKQKLPVQQYCDSVASKCSVSYWFWML